MAARLANLSPGQFKVAQLAIAVAGATEIALGLAFAFFGPLILPDPDVQGFLILAGVFIALLGVGVLIWAYKFLPKFAAKARPQGAGIDGR